MVDFITKFSVVIGKGDIYGYCMVAMDFLFYIYSHNKRTQSSISKFKFKQLN